MCGIAGAIGVPTNEIRTSIDVLKHRGPDGTGIWTSEAGDVVLAQQRLAIIDLTAGGSQPMLSASGRFAITFNGEIYNYKELRQELVALGERFTSASDTEVLLRCCMVFGPVEAAKRAIGMFAFSFVDLEKRLMWLARDRFGEKPLYYAIWNGKLAFASELKALLAIPQFPRDLDRVALDHFLQQMYVPAPRSIFRAASKVMPGTALRIPLDDVSVGTLRTETYWSSADEALSARSSLFTGSFSDATDELERLLTRAVQSQLLSDVTLGAFLSGGIDSSTIVSLMAQLASNEVKTFTIGFTDKKLDESPAARAIAKHLHTDHTELMVTDQDALDVVPLLADMYCEPFADSSQIPTYLVAKLARQHVTVSLSGDAGDELFGGYDRFFSAERIQHKMDRIPAVMRRPLGRGIQHAAGAALRGADLVADRSPAVARFSATLATGGRAGRMLARSSHIESYRDFTTCWPGTVDLPERLTNNARVGSRVNEYMLADTNMYLPDDILVKVDRAAMATSLETRVPFLDPRVFRFAWSLPDDFRYENSTGKRVVRAVLDRHIPSSLWDRPKMGFAVPLKTWILGPLRPWADDLLSQSSLEESGALPVEEIRKTWKRFCLGVPNLEHQIWTVLMFQAWQRRWLKR